GRSAGSILSIAATSRRGTGQAGLDDAHTHGDPRLPFPPRGRALALTAIESPAPGVLASPGPSRYTERNSANWARSSAGEHYVDIVGVTGSIPVAPTIRTSIRVRNEPYGRPRGRALS